MVYSEAFKKRMIQKLIGPNSKSAYELSKEVGVSRVTLTAWLNKMKDERSMNSYDSEPHRHLWIDFSFMPRIPHALNSLAE